MTDLFEAAVPATRMPGKPIPSWTPPELPPRRSRRRPVIAVAIAVVLLGGLVIGLWLPGRNTQSNTTAQTQTPTQSQPQQQPQPPVSPEAVPQVDPPAAVDGVTPPAKPAPVDRRAPAAAAPAPAAAEQPAAAPPPAPPKVEAQLVNPYPVHKAGCDGDRAGVIATVSSDGEPRAVELISSGPGSAGKTVAMTKVGSGWVAALGPYRTVGNATWMVRITDAHGVTASGPESRLPVVAC